MEPWLKSIVLFLFTEVSITITLPKIEAGGNLSKTGKINKINRLINNFKFKMFDL